MMTLLDIRQRYSLNNALIEAYVLYRNVQQSRKKFVGNFTPFKGCSTLLGIIGVKYLAYGLIGVFSILFVEFLNKFDESHAITSLLIGIQLAVFYMFGKFTMYILFYTT